MSTENTGKWRNHNNQVRKMELPDLPPLEAVPGEPSAHVWCAWDASNWRNQSQRVEEGEATGTGCAYGSAVFCVYMCGYVLMLCMCAFTWWVPIVNHAQPYWDLGTCSCCTLTTTDWPSGLVNSQHTAAVSLR